MRARKSGPLQGVRVVSLPWHMSAKVAGMLMADHGAAVVELERQGDEPEPGWEFAEQCWRRGKALVEFEYIDQLTALVSEADVLITDYSHSALEALGVSLEALLAQHPRLICLQISGYGRASSSEAEPWSEFLLWARQGMYWRQVGYRDGPKTPTVLIASYATAFNSVTATLAALLVRNATGRGQLVETSLADGLASQQALFWNWAERDRSPDTPVDVHAGGMGRLVLESYICADAEWLTIVSASKGAFSRLMTLAGLDDRIPPIPTDATSEIGQPIERWQLDLIHDALPTLFAAKSRAEWLRILRDHDIPAMPDLSPGEVYVDPQTLENQLTTLVTLASGESVRTGGAVIKFSETPANPAFMAERRVTLDQALAELRSAARRAPPPTPRAGKPAAQFPLAGLRVLDFGTFFAGPYAGRVLADLGADVIRIEPPSGCPMRYTSGGRYFNAANHHKRTLAINLKAPEARPVIERLAQWADIVQHNLRPGVAEALGMGYEDLREINPRLIYCHSPAFGSLGPYRDLPGFEPLSSAITGVMMRHADCRYVGPYGSVGNMDQGNGLLAAAGMLMALYHRDRTGQGQYVECPQLGVAILSTLEVVMREDGEIVDPLAVDEAQLGSAWWRRLYACSDNWIVVHAWTATARKALLDIAGSTGDDVADKLAAWAEGQTAADTVRHLREAGVPVEAIASPHRNDDYFFNEENVRLGRIIEFGDLPKWGRYRELGQFWRFSTSPLRQAKDGHMAADVGAFSRQILKAQGFGDAEIQRLVAAGIVGAPAPATPAAHATAPTVAAR
jgi:crotonobetainyl-CoA:carnitine CoA-transferase CaiB-like acyl-CoA transferase